MPQAPATRDRILDGAVRAVARHGVAKLGMRDVSESAGVARGTVYRYFGTREDLLSALRQREAERFLGQVLEAMAGAPAGPERLRVTLEMATRQLREHAALRRLLESDPALVLESLRERFPEIRERLGALLAPILDDTAPARSGLLSVERLVDWTTRFLISLYLFEEEDPEGMAADLQGVYEALRRANRRRAP